MFIIFFLPYNVCLCVLLWRLWSGLRVPIGKTLGRGRLQGFRWLSRRRGWGRCQSPQWNVAKTWSPSTWRQQRGSDRGCSCYSSRLFRGPWWVNYTATFYRGSNDLRNTRHIVHYGEICATSLSIELSHWHILCGFLFLQDTTNSLCVFIQFIGWRVIMRWTESK